MGCIIPYGGTCDGASAIAVDSVGAIDGVLCSLGSVPIFPHGKNAVHGTSAVAVLCKRTLMSSVLSSESKNLGEGGERARNMK